MNIMLFKISTHDNILQARLQECQILIVFNLENIWNEKSSCRIADPLAHHLCTAAP
jgi:hypothetical protein